MTTVEIQTNPGRIDAVRHLSDQAVSTRATALAFQVEALTEAGPAIARTLRTAAADLRRAAEASGPRDAFSALSDALALLEQL